MKLICITVFVSVGFIACHRNNIPAELNTQGDQLENRWMLTSIAGFPESLPPIAQEVYIQLDSNRLTGFAGCNSLFGGYASGGDTLQFGPVGSTKKFCNTGMEIETALLRGLTLTTRYKIQQNQLELFREDSLLVRFRLSVIGDRYR